MTRFIRYIIGVVLCLLIVLPQLEAQQIKYAEYFFDNDPGKGNATSVSITQANTLDANYSISTASLSGGIHFLFFRVKDEYANWSLVNSQLVYITTNLSNSDITAAEYFFDIDPGKGSGTSVSIISGNTVDFDKTIATSGISAGIHFLYFRVKNAGGLWSLTNSKLLYITENSTTSSIVDAEYFFDTDPGFGNASTLTFVTGDTVNISSSISIASISSGLHYLNVRVKNADGKWSLLETRLLYKSANINNGQITAAEYFFDTDPGFGQGSSMSFTSGDTVNILSQLNTTSLDAGIHQLYIRVKNANGRWSLAEKNLVYIISGHLSSPKITEAEYFFDIDPGLGNGTAFNVTAGNTIDVSAAISSSALNIGHHLFYVRAKDSLGRWSLNDQRLVYVTPTLANQKITAIEYSVDTIMPFGLGNIVNFAPTDSLDYSFNFVHGIIDTFYHALYTRVKDVGGRWSLLDSVNFRLENCIIPTANFTLNDICFGDSIILSNTSSNIDTSSIFYWDILNDGQIESYDSVGYQVGFSQPGNYKINLKVENFVCIDTIIKTIHVFPKPDTTISVFGNLTFCPGNFSVLSANSGIGYQYQWLKNGNPISNATSNFYQAQDSGLFSAAINNIYNCKDTTIQIELNMYDLPTATISNSGTNSFCEGDSVILSANQTVGLTYIWYKNGTIISGENNSTLNVNSQGAYKVEISNVDLCSDMSSVVNIVVNPVPTSNITAGGNTTFCQGNNVTLYGSNGVGYSYQWFKDGSLLSGANSSFYSATQSGQYKVYIANAFQCGDTSQSSSVTVNPSPVSTITLGGQATICQGDTVQLTGSVGVGNTYQWKSYGTNLQSATSQIYNALQTGNYTLVTTNSLNCSTESAPQLVTVNPNPGASILPLSSTSFCGGDSVILQANAGVGLSYKWYKNSNLLSADTLTNLIANSSGAYTVAVTNNYNCSSNSASLNVTTFPIPTSSFSVATSVCSSDTTSIIYIGSASAGAFYNWNFDGAMVISGTGQGPYGVRWNSAGYKTITLIVSENGCASQTTSLQTEVKTVLASITAPITSVCEGDSVLLTANSGQNLDYTWYQGGLILAGNTLSNLVVSNSGLYQVKVTNSVLGCSQLSQAKTVNVNSTNFNLAFAATTTNFTQPPFDASLNNTTPNMNNYNFQWELGDGSTSTFYNPLHTYLYNGSYTVAMYAENSSTGCRDTLIKPNYIVCAGGSPNPCNIIAAITPAGPITICTGDSVLLSASVGTGYSYQWAFNNTLISNASSSTYYAKQSGNYRVIITNTVCSQTSPAFVLNHFPSILPTIQSSGIIQPCTTDSMQLSLFVNYNNYNWSTGATSPSIYVSQTGYYQVAVTDNYGCNMTSMPYIVSNSFLNPPEICLVGVDSLNHNRMIWERQVSVLIDSFYIYREGFILGQYDKIGAIPFTQSSLFVDVNSNPAVKAYKYKIAAMDTCGGLTLLSNFHKTIHLTINAGLNGSWNLIWDGYQGFNFNTYRIYRGTNVNAMTLLTQLPSSAMSYTDLSPPSGTVYYQIEVIKSTGCYPDSINSKANTNYNTSRSNTANNGNIVPVYLTADFSANVQTGVWPVQVGFTDNSTGNPDQWKWHFGDGNTSIEQNPIHTYNNTGLYTVSLIICNGPVCDTVVKQDYIEVLPNGMVEIGVELAAKLYPNPNDGNFTLEINDKGIHQLDLHVYNTLGQEVYLESFESIGKTIKVLNLNSLSAGVYYLHLNTGEKMVYKTKIVIQR